MSETTHYYYILTIAYIIRQIVSTSLDKYGQIQYYIMQDKDTKYVCKIDEDEVGMTTIVVHFSYTIAWSVCTLYIYGKKERKTSPGCLSILTLWWYNAPGQFNKIPSGCRHHQCLCVCMCACMCTQCHTLQFIQPTLTYMERCRYSLHFHHRRSTIAHGNGLNIWVA